MKKFKWTCVDIRNNKLDISIVKIPQFIFSKLATPYLTTFTKSVVGKASYKTCVITIHKNVEDGVTATEVEYDESAPDFFCITDSSLGKGKYACTEKEFESARSKVIQSIKI